MKNLFKSIVILMMFLSNQLCGMSPRGDSGDEHSGVSSYELSEYESSGYESSSEEGSEYESSSEESFEKTRKKGKVFILNGTSCSGKSTLSGMVKELLCNHFKDEYEFVVVGIDDDCSDLEYDEFESYWEYRSNSCAASGSLKSSGGYVPKMAKNLYKKYKGEDEDDFIDDGLFGIQGLEISRYPNVESKIGYLKESSYGLLIDRIRDLVEEGKIVICDVVLADETGKESAESFIGEFIRELVLEEEDVFTILVHCPFMQIFARVEKRNKGNNAEEKRTLDQPLFQFLSLFRFANSKHLKTNLKRLDSFDEKKCIESFLSTQESWSNLEEKVRNIILAALLGKLKDFTDDDSIVVLPACEHNLIVTNNHEKSAIAEEQIFDFIVKKIS